MGLEAAKEGGDGAAGGVRGGEEGGAPDAIAEDEGEQLAEAAGR